jgi:DNA-binding NarL/FixJ family response regulator
VKKTSIIIADDHPYVHRALSGLLDAVPGFDVVAEVGNADEALRFTASLRPTVLVLDIDMPGTDAFQAAAEVKQLSPGTEVVFLSGTLSDQFIDNATKSGALAFVVKSDDAEEVVSAIHAVSKGKHYYSPSVRDRLSKRPIRNDGTTRLATRLATLSPRERETLRYIARGMSKKEIAPCMHITVKTVDKHVTQVMSKLDIHDRVELARFALREGLVEL